MKIVCYLKNSAAYRQEQLLWLMKLGLQQTCLWSANIEWHDQRGYYLMKSRHTWNYWTTAWHAELIIFSWNCTSILKTDIRQLHFFHTWLLHTWRHTWTSNISDHIEVKYWKTVVWSETQLLTHWRRPTWHDFSKSLKTVRQNWWIL